MNSLAQHLYHVSRNRSVISNVIGKKNKGRHSVIINLNFCLKYGNLTQKAVLKLKDCRTLGTPVLGLNKLTIGINSRWQLHFRASGINSGRKWNSSTNFHKMFVLVPSLLRLVTRVRVTLRLAVYRQSVHLGVKHLEAHNLSFFVWFCFLQLNPYDHSPCVTSSLTRKWVMTRISSDNYIRIHSALYRKHITPPLQRPTG
jgi:hypothetical protein